MIKKFMDIIESIEGITDDWFAHGSFETFKKPAVEKYEIATEPGVIDTLEGPMNYEAGHYIMTGPNGEKYPISPEKFHEYKNDLGDGQCTPKKIFKRAKLANHDGVIHTKRGDLIYTTGNDYIVRHGPDDYGVVKKDIFHQTYDTSGEKND
jgi:PGDYG protein